MRDAGVWERVRRELSIGDVVGATAVRAEPFGVFVEVDEYGLGLLEAVTWHRFKHEPMPAVGARLSCRVIGFRDDNKQIALAPSSRKTPDEEVGCS